MKTHSGTTTLSLAILGLVSLKPHSGYDLRKVFSTTPMGHFSASPGAIYPALRRLEQVRLIKGTVEKRDSLRPRQTYAITGRGMKILRETLSRPVTRRDIVWRLEELILRFAFMGDTLGRARSLEFLEELSARIDEYVPDLQEHRNVQIQRGAANGAYALEQGIAKYEATARWAKRVIEELTEV